MSDGGTVFTVKFACDNCGEEWSEDFHEKVRVWRMNEIPPFPGNYRSQSVPSRLFASDAREEPMKEELIGCPKCKTYQDVKIVQRLPIEERSTID